MNSWKVILATMVIFGTGVVTGGLLVYSTQRGPRQPWHATPAPPRAPLTSAPGALRLDLLRRMEHELDLSPEQRERIDKILKEGQERTKRIMEPIEPDLHQVVQRAREDFLAVLTPEQRARFEELIKQQQQQQRAKDQRKQSPSSHQPFPPATAPSSTNTPP